MKKPGKIVAIIPVRKGSQRVPNKNFKPFANKSLLQIKIESLLQVPEINEIIINTDSDEAIEMAKKYKIKWHRRDKYYASSKCNNSDYWKHLAETTNGDYLILAQVTAPLIKSETISKIIKRFMENEKYDSIMTVNLLKQFLWLNGKPLNYDINNVPKSQDLPDIIFPTFSLSIISRDIQIQNSNVIGEKPDFYILNDIESVDIDYPIDFEIAEYLYKKFRN